MNAITSSVEERLKCIGWIFIVVFLKAGPPILPRLPFAGTPQPDVIQDTDAESVVNPVRDAQGPIRPWIPY